MIVVGAGPAGALLAYELASRSLDVCLIERETLPRYKPCGGGLQVKAAKLLPFDVSEVVEKTTYGVVVTHNSRRPVRMTYPRPLVHMVMRDRFDYLLVRQAARRGSIVIPGERVVKYSEKPSGVAVETASGLGLEALILVGADGASGIVGRLAGLDQGYSYGIAVESEVEPGPESTTLEEGLMAIDLGSLPGGYRWAFPKKDGLSIGAGAPARAGRLLGASMDDWLAHWGSPGARRTSHLLKFRTGARPPVRRGRVVLIGEAAGLIDSLTGEGIYWALKSAILAVPSILRAVSEGPSELDAYVRAIETDVTPELLAARSLLPVVHAAPAITHALFMKAAWPSFCRLFRGEDTYVRLYPKRLARWR
ncbi:MAG: NAD(P)/FAD-dependent oxidoreductase [Candidatus Aquicultorales bacterium]